jgi:hypothetical protein
VECDPPLIWPRETVSVPNHRATTSSMLKLVAQTTDVVVGAVAPRRRNFTFCARNYAFPSLMVGRFGGNEPKTGENYSPALRAA